MLEINDKKRRKNFERSRINIPDSPAPCDLTGTLLKVGERLEEEYRETHCKNFFQLKIEEISEKKNNLNLRITPLPAHVLIFHVIPESSSMELKIHRYDIVII